MKTILYSGLSLALGSLSAVPAQADQTRDDKRQETDRKQTPEKDRNEASEEEWDGVPVEIVVTGSTPLLGSGLDANKVPNAAYVFSRRDLSRTGEPSLIGTLDSWAGSINMNATIGNQNQPDVQFRGFTASPLQGLPQGLAVYQNGIRINEAFGDTVNWDLIPMIAMDSMNLTSSNPVFGFNALGGAVALEMKSGRTWQGVAAEASTGSFGRFNASAEIGKRWDDWSVYAAISRMGDSGWRERMPSRGVQVYSDLGYDAGGTSAHLTINAADNYLVGTGPTPEALLALYPRTAPGLNYPAYNKNRLFMVAGQISQDLGGDWRLDGRFYVRSFRQRLLNGNVTDASPCPDNPDYFCSSGTDDSKFPLYDTLGRHVPVSAGGDYPAELDWAHTRTNSRGGSLMLTRNARLFGHGNHLVIGGSFDHGNTIFGAGAEIGSFDLDRNTHGSGLQVDSQGAIRQVLLRTRNQYAGFYISDTFDITKRLSLTVSARYNIADLRLRDQRGSLLDGDHRFTRFNPGVGATWRFLENTTAYINYAETNRVPTAAELSCSDPEIPCTLASFFMSDPPLEQVVSRTWEGGLRGEISTGGNGRISWNGSVFRTVNSNDILEIASGIPGRGYFQNAGRTRRQGVEINTSYKDGKWRLFANYSLIDATYRSPLTLNSPFNPFANEDGEIFVRVGNSIPGVPKHRLKLGLDRVLTEKWSAGASVQAVSSQVLFQDQANQTPRLPGYAVASIHSAYALGSGVQLFGSVNNLFDRRYSVYGTWTAASGVPFPQLPGGEIGVTRAFGAAPPRAFIVGIKVKR